MVVKVVAIIVFVVFGARHISLENYSPFMPSNTGDVGEFGLTGIVHAAGMLYFAFIGFDAVATTAEEQRDPARTLPRAILISLLICTAMYVSFSLVLTGALSYREIASQRSVVDAYQRLF